MIDPHVHLRDWNQAHKETLRHGLSIAYRAGLDGVFEMPNTDPPLVSRETILRRIEDADKALRQEGIGIFHGLYAGLTPDPRQIEEVVRAFHDLFPRVVGLKMFAGHSTGKLGIVEKDQQALVYRTLAALGFTGVLAVHCEKESLLRPDAWDPSRPSSHARARPPSAEVASVDEQLQLARAAGFSGTLHICHISTPFALDLLRGKHTASEEATTGMTAHAGGSGPIADSAVPRVTCGLTPHHALLDAEMMDREGGIVLKTNPPLRPQPMPALMLERLLAGEIDWIETDHAPHTLAEKSGAGAASGIPTLPFHPKFIKMLSEKGLSEEWIKEVTHDAICRTFGISIPMSGRAPEFDLTIEYQFDPFGMAGF